MSEPTTVYQYFASSGQLIYVGVTGRGAKRMREHAESKAWWSLATGCTLEHFDAREPALARESELIARHRPPYNQQGNPERALPLAERTGSDRINRPAHGRPDSLRAARKAWYALPPTARATAPCVRCGLRPGLRGPECLNCHQERGHYRDAQVSAA